MRIFAAPDAPVTFTTPSKWHLVSDGEYSRLTSTLSSLRTSYAERERIIHDLILENGALRDEVTRLRAERIAS